MFIPDLRQHLPAYPDSVLQTLAGMSRDFPFYMNLSGALIGLFGAAFSIWAISHLRASFGLRAAVRELVTSGPYRRIRHPLYVGWLFVMWATPTMTIAHLFFAVVASLYILVAIQFEENDLKDAHPEYESYRQRVPMLIPSIGRLFSKPAVTEAG